MTAPDARHPSRQWTSLAVRDGTAPPAPDLDAAIRAELSLPDTRQGVSRRSFLQLAGFGLAAAGLAGCSRGPERRAYNLLKPQPELAPGQVYEVATTCAGCPAGCGVLARCRDGRPVKLEGNPEHPLSRGGLCAVGQAEVLSLYDGKRLSGPFADGVPAGWRAADDQVIARLERARREGRAVRLLTGTRHGPSTRAALDGLLASLPDARHVSYDVSSASALADAWQATRGVRALPRFDFERAQVIVAFDADVLGTWISPVEHAAAYARGRRVDDGPGATSRHWQFEARLSPTGGRADRRVRLAPWQTGAALAHLCAALAKATGAAAPGGAPSLPASVRPVLDQLAAELLAHRGRSLVVCGSDDRHAQVLALWANELLGNVGKTLDASAPSFQRLGDDSALAALRDELLAGRVDLLITAGCDPAADLPGFAAALDAAGMHVACTGHDDATAARAELVFPEPHALECWDDAEPVAGVLGLRQPTVPPLREARTLRASLARWQGDGCDDRELLAAHWREHVFPRQTALPDFDLFFDAALERGVVELPAAPAPVEPFRHDAVNAAWTAVTSTRAPDHGRLGLVLHTQVALPDGCHAQNPWLQELPDPVTKAVWGNQACLSPAAASARGLADGDVVRLTADDGAALELPVLVQPGQHDEVVAVALGHGRRGTDRFARIGPRWIQGRDTVEPGGVLGVAAEPLLRLGPDGLRDRGATVTLEPTGAHREPARTQDHHRLELPAGLAIAGRERRDAVRSLAVTALAAGRGPVTAEHGAGGELWPDDHAGPGPRWGLVIDLAACTGCSACVIGCQAENNVPVVGRDEVARHREMSWLRIDRYYETDARDPGNVHVVHQPVMCQHCGHAPCETVCPVLATVHSAEGLNTQVYNRCVGTRYCANNCPYKVRRFNWFDYEREDRMADLVLNPSVTVRSRGVMEKCTLCLQRIQAAKAAAGREGRPLRDGEFQVACQQSCPTRAITFGDLADPRSEVARRAAGPRAYALLGELNVRPGVRYLAHVHHDPGRPGATAGEGGHG